MKEEVVIVGISQEKREKEEKKGKELTSSSRGTGDVGIGKYEEPLGLPFSMTLLFYQIEPKKMGPLQFCLPVFLGIHRNPKQKEFFNLHEGFLR